MMWQYRDYPPHFPKRTWGQGVRLKETMGSLGPLTVEGKLFGPVPKAASVQLRIHDVDAKVRVGAQTACGLAQRPKHSRRGCSTAALGTEAYSKDLLQRVQAGKKASQIRGARAPKDVPATSMLQNLSCSEGRIAVALTAT